MSPDERARTLFPPALAMILAAAAGLRLYGLNGGLWHDEILTLINYARLPIGDIVTTYGDQNQHILYSILAHASLEAFGESAWALRFPAALFGLASIWALYAFAIEVTDRREALFAAALLAASYHHVWFSQNARGYSGLLFWTLLSSWLLLRGLRGSGRGVWGGYAGAVALGMYTHLTMLFVTVAQFGVFLRDRYKRRVDPRQGLLVGFGLAGLLTFTLYAPIVPQVLASAAREGSVVAAWMNPLWTLAEFARAFRFGAAGVLVGGMGLIVTALGVHSYVRSAPAVLWLLAGSTGLCGAVMIALGHHLWPRLFFFAAGFGVLVVVRGAMQAGRLIGARVRWATPEALGGALCALLILASLVSLPRAWLPKQDYDAALRFLEAQRAPGDVVLAVGLAAIPANEYYEAGWKVVESAQALQLARAAAERTWLVYTFPLEAVELYPEVMGIVEREFEIVKEFPGTVGGGNIVVSRGVGR